MQGRFIVLEGPDGSGTTRHSQMLADNLRAQGIETLLTVEPTEGSIGKDIRQILSTSSSMPPPDAVQLLFCADRAQHVAEVIQPALDAGKTVISDRYALSTIIYGAALGLDPEWLQGINSAFPSPDLTIITLPPLSVCMERIGRRSEQDHFENELFMRRIYDGYKAIEDPNTVFVDTSGSKQDVAQSVLDIAQPLSRETITVL